MKETYISLNGRITPYEEAKIHVSSVAMKYGASVFEGIRGYWNEEQKELYLFALEQHLKRLLDSMNLMGMEHDYSVDKLIFQVEEIVKANQLKQDCYIRVAASIEADGPLDTRGPVLLNIAAFPQGRKPIQTGIKVSISSWTRLSDNMMPPRIKCVANYQNGRIALLLAKTDGYDNTILLNQNGKVAEAPTAAVFLVKNGVLTTPVVTDGILESITRRFLIEVARELNIPIIERQIDRSECYLADEAFLCGTGAEILPIRSIDHYLIGDGKDGIITQRLKDFYFDVVYGKKPKYSHLLFPIYNSKG
ncbi:branched-chain amino acid transaminase [Aneurinibacillus thermoaerophilus]|uniref:Branched-chain-amino-acid aminotransferase n=1 Tax=Aneurinibacillus thermoaerophilus TaxID=143495 RepID=A0A1G8F365_ANETH|nr:branched-chain amino acid transaminase [Aneurinibacillus thermoaerophilus]MED0758918.1 branched-chain amino acid transaminase [Aneurinibacillus thermoaerophilus]MED0760632.1 branched-chain amino acid transaminase [Aneurinibacillus thermoaerophilus]SDH76595.1 branched-chain amino acid aminotransferase [Aneurinibacillus thermoaerophilus]